MGIRRGMARTAISAGLGATLAVAPFGPALAEPGAADTPVVGESANPSYEDQVRGESTGDTKLYVIGSSDDLTTSEGSITENVKVSIPVAIHYVADSEGNLVGPSNNVVKFVNHTNLGAVHVSKIAVQNAENSSIVKSGETLGNDQMCFFMRPAQGQSDEAGAAFVAGAATEGTGSDFKLVGEKDELGNYANHTHGQVMNPVNKDDWNIAQKHGALALNDLAGRIGGFGAMDAATDTQVGTVHWTVRAGTRAQADAKDAIVTVHFNSNNGSNANCVPVGDQRVQVLRTQDLPNKVALEEGLSTPLDAGAEDVVAPRSLTNPDGTVTSYRFAGWNTAADGSGKAVSTIGDMGSAEELAGTVRELYAIFEEQ